MGKQYIVENIVKKRLVGKGKKVSMAYFVREIGSGKLVINFLNIYEKFHIKHET